MQEDSHLVGICGGNLKHKNPFGHGLWKLSNAKTATLELPNLDPMILTTGEYF